MHKCQLDAGCSVTNSGTTIKTSVQRTKIRETGRASGNSAMLRHAPRTVMLQVIRPAGRLNLPAGHSVSPFAWNVLALPLPH